MRKFLLALALCATAVAFGEERTATDASVKSFRVRHRAKMDVRDRREAARQGITVEELKAQRKAKGEERQAARLGMAVEDYRKLTPEARQAKFAELRERETAERETNGKETKQGDTK